MRQPAPKGFRALLGFLVLPCHSGGEAPDGAAPSLKSLEPKTWSLHLSRAACELPAASGQLNGICVDEVRDLQGLIPFCGDVVQYRACIPANQPLWPNWNATRKDTLISRLYKDVVERRLAKEMNVTPNEYVEMHLLSNPDCFTALKNALCWHNFPKCNDQNVSLPLCRQSCNHFYSACDYGVAEGALHDACSEESVQTSGLFSSGSPGKDQQLAEDNVTCESTSALAEQYAEEETADSTWLLSPPGLALMGLIGLVIFGSAYVLLVPYGLRVYISWAFRQLVTIPVVWFRKLPSLKGTTCLALFVGLFLVFSGFGLYWRTRPGMALSERFALDFNTSTDDDPGAVFKPEPAAHEVSVEVELTRQQMRTLIGSCGCTGGGMPGKGQPGDF